LSEGPIVDFFYPVPKISPFKLDTLREGISLDNSHTTWNRDTLQAAAIKRTYFYHSQRIGEVYILQLLSFIETFFSNTFQR
jgi:hypothetical protein